MAIAVGIDLGTSNSVVSYFDGTTVQTIADSEGRTIHPSVVAYGYGNTAVVGYRAKQQLSYAPENTISSAKRLIGQHFDKPEVQKMRKQMSWGIVQGPHNDARIRVQGQIYTPQEVSAHVLLHLKKIAEEMLNKPVEQAVITVPAYFNDQQRQATRDAAEIAGLQCLRILNEPTAAALAYGHKNKKTQHVAVFDLGGGTFDISILRIKDDFYEVLSTSGDTFLGGDDFDWAITEELMRVVKQNHGVDLSKRYVAQAKLRKAAEEAKIVLSHESSAQISIPSLTRSKKGEMIHLQHTLNRRDFRVLTSPLIDRCIHVAQKAIQEAQLSTIQIENCLLVGGMTRSPLVREAVEKFFGKSPISDINPDEVVSMGAAIQAHNLQHQNNQTVLLDVTPQSLGISTQGGFVSTIIAKNTSVPVEQSQIFTTTRDNQTEVRIKVYQGESGKSKENTFLGDFVLKELRSALRGEIEIRVTFQIDADGILQVSARNEETGSAVSMYIEEANRLSQLEKTTLKDTVYEESS
jgi:molecular chaperone DnaK